MAVLATWVAIFLTMVWYDSIATAYDESRRKLDWDYCQCSGSFREVLTWWWRR
jgi:hypothetical protein